MTSPQEMMAYVLVDQYEPAETLESLAGKFMHWTRHGRRAKVLCNRGLRLLHESILKMHNHAKQFAIYHVPLAWMKDHWHMFGYQFRTEPNWFGRVHANMHINMQEAHAAIMMLRHCRHLLTGRRLWLLCDNQVCVHSITKAWSGSYHLLDHIQ